MKPPDTNPQEPDMGRWVTIPEAVAHFDRNERTIRRWIKRGTIRHKNEGGRALVLVYALSDKGPDRQPDIGPDTDRPGPDAAELEAIRGENRELRARLEEVSRQRDYLEQALAAAMSKIPQIEARASDPESNLDSAIAEKRRRWWWEFWK